MIDFDIDLPKYTETAELGEKGGRMIANVVEDELHWIFMPTTKTDVGIDGEIEYVTREHKCTGKLKKQITGIYFGVVQKQ